MRDETELKLLAGAALVFKPVTILTLVASLAPGIVIIIPRRGGDEDRYHPSPRR